MNPKTYHEKHYGLGTSKSAQRRRAERNRGKLLTGKPGEVVRASDRTYRVGPTGALRRMS